MNRIFCFLLLFATSGSLVAQFVHPQGHFFSDSTKLGSPVKYSLTVDHKPEVQILFPDSSYNFAPFELIRKEYFPTVTANGISKDSAVYLLRTFDLARAQSLALPVFMTTDGDSTSVFCQPDTILLHEYLPEYPANTDFREQAKFSPVETDFNYPYILAGIAAVAIAAFILYFFFGRSIRRRYRLVIIRTDHDSFLKNFQKLQRDFSATQRPRSLEQALSVWKAYLARLENKPINTYTTTEIINLYNQEELKDGLNVIDRAIYGGFITGDVEKAVGTLRKFSVRQYHKIKREIQNG